MPLGKGFDTEDRDRLGHFEATVAQSFWSTPTAETQGEASYEGAGRSKLYFHLTDLDIVQEGFEVPDESVVRSFSIGDRAKQGSDWLISEDGFTIRHSDDRSDKNPNAKPILPKSTSGLGQFLGIILGKQGAYSTQNGEGEPADGGGPVHYDLGPVADYLNSQPDEVDARDALIWVGFRFLWRGLAMPYNRDEPPVPQNLPVAMLLAPTVFRGGGGGAGANPANTGTGTSQPALDEEASKALAAKVSETLPKDTPAEVVGELAMTLHLSSSHTEFMRETLSSHPTLRDQITDADKGPWSVK